MIIGDYKIKKMDNLNLVVQINSEKKRKGEGEESGKWIGTGVFEYKDISYHPNFEKALKWIIDKELNDAEIETAKDLINKIKELKSLVEGVIK